MKTALSSFARAMPGAVLLVNRSGVLDAVNDEARHRLGLAKAVSRRLSLAEVCDLTPGEANELVRQALSAAEPIPCRLPFRSPKGDGVSYRAEAWRVGNIREAWAAFRVLFDHDRYEKFTELARTIDDLNREIRTRKEVEAALRKSEGRFRQIADALPVPVLMTRVSNGEILFANPAFEDLYRLPRGSAPGRLSREFYPEGVSRETLLRVFEENDGQIDGLEWEYRRPDDGTAVWVEITARLIEFQGETAILATAVDVTERKRLRELERENQRLLLQTNRMEALGNLAGGIAHDFNNLLQPIILQAHMARFGLPQDSPARANLDNILSSAERASALIGKIFAFGRSGSGCVPTQPHDVFEVVADAVDLVRRTLPATVRMEADLDRETGKCALDADSVGQIAMNLAVNANQAMGGHGTIWIALKREEVEEKQPSFDMVLEPGRYARLTVADEGPGIAPEVRERLFEPFFTTKKIGEGTGLGLSVVHGLVKQCGGVIFVESAPGEGARFDIFLPLIEGEA